MSEDTGQLSANKTQTVETPKVLWTTALGRAIFGFYCETSTNPSFVNDDYIRMLCDTQNRNETAYGKVVLYAFALSVISIATANNAIGEASYFGLNFSQIPYLTEFCSLTLGAFVSLLVFQLLDLFTMTRMRHELFSLSGSENPNMRMLHMKGNGAWIDAFIPKSKGYESNVFHKIIQALGLLWSLTLPATTILMVLTAQSICISSVWPITDFALSDAIVWVGIAISASSVLMLILAVAVPLKFTFNSEFTAENGENHPESG
ncbi:MAG: hypothetical protein HWE35_18100 [Rhodobacteraceae bacterium]|nr:hypothetical protein [Paracoccaceae bacterium]